MDGLEEVKKYNLDFVFTTKFTSTKNSESRYNFE